MTYKVDKEDRPIIFSSVTGWLLMILYFACCTYAVWQGSMFSVFGSMACILLCIRRLFSRGSMLFVTIMTGLVVIAATVVMWNDKSLTFTFDNIRDVFKYNLFFIIIYGFLGCNKRLNFMEKGGKGMYLLILAIGTVVQMSGLFIIDEIIEIIEIGLFVALILAMLFGGEDKGNSSSSSGSGDPLPFKDVRGIGHANSLDRDAANRDIFGGKNN